MANEMSDSGFQLSRIINKTHIFQDEINVSESVLIEDTNYCRNDLPSLTEYYSAIPDYMLALIVMTNLIFLATLGYYANRLPRMLRNTPTKVLSRTVLLNGIYPVVAGACFIAITVPRTFLLCDSISHLAFTFGAYQLFSLCLDYVEGESIFIANADDQALSFRTPPCCCCLCCLHPMPITKRRFLAVRILVLQLPIIQSIIFVALNIINLENPQVYRHLFPMIIPMIVVSVLLGVWGLNIIVRMVAPYYPEYNIMPKYFVLQAVLVLCKVQPGIGELIINVVPFNCTWPITPFIHKNVIVQSIIMLEMFLLSIWAQKLYELPKAAKRLHRNKT